MKRRFIYFLLFLFLLFLSRHWMFEKTVSFHPISEQSTFQVTDDSFHQYLTNTKTENEIEKAILEALDLTAVRLSFASQKTEVDPNLSFHGKRAHCVGYAAFFATACNFLLEKNGLADKWQAKHVRGKISFLGIDLHQFSDSPFFHDHDFNVVEKTESGERFIVDASVWDVLWVKVFKTTSSAENKPVTQ